MFDEESKPDAILSDKDAETFFIKMLIRPDRAYYDDFPTGEPIIKDFNGK